MSFIAPILSVFGAMQSFSAAGKAREAGRMNAQRIQEETGEEVRRKEIGQKQFMGTSVARAGASGVKASSFQNQWDFLEGEFGKELDWMRKSGTQRARIAEQTGEYQAKSATASGFGGMGRAAGGFYSAGKNQGWWGG